MQLLIRELEKLYFFFSIKNGAHVRLHSNVGLGAADLRLKMKDNIKTREINVGD